MVSSFDANVGWIRKCEVVSTLECAAPLTAPVFIAVGNRLADTRSAVNLNHASSVARRRRNYALRSVAASS